MISTTRVPSDRTAPISLSIAVVADGSRLEVGSSRIRISGPVASARAIDSSCCSPPDRTRAGECARCVSLARSSAAWARRVRSGARQRRRPPARTRRWPAPSGAAAPAAGTRSRSSVRGAGPAASRPSSPGPPSARPGRPARAPAGSCRRRSGRSAPACRCRSISMSMPSRMRRPPRSKTSPRRGSAGPRRRVDRAVGVELMVSLRHRPSASRSPAEPSTSALMAMAMVSRIRPRPRASARSPLEVSSAMAVVITRVT